MQKVKLSDYGFNILQLETQANCNMACSFCPYPLKDDKSSKYSMAEIKNILDQIDIEDEYFQYVTFSQYNEPLLDSRIFEILEYTNMKNIKTLFITNGLLLNKDKNVDGLLNTNPKVKISLQVLDQNKHKDARGLNMELDEYVNTITKKRTGVGTITPKEFLTLVKHPTSALNFLGGRKVPLNDLERFRKEFVKSNS